ncbi:MAG TPA: OmpA family protein, partial [Xanthobacteraceae bacterium]|nr:OmpA family protein [Xanthobacteraceae bacterium]
MAPARKLWIGLLLLVLLWLVSAWIESPLVEQNLTARTTDALKGVVLDKLTVAGDGRDVTLGATAFSEEGRRSAVQAADAVDGVRLVNDTTTLV